jgi:adenine-specific DNA-methyltransferase
MTDPNLPERMSLDSMDVAAQKRAELKALLGQQFPEVFAEDRIDFDQLKRVLGDWVEPNRERFGLTWPGKAECMRIIQEPSVATLKPQREESVNFDDTGNIFIEGDNLEVLKLLQKSYFGKIKMIYIDPPYNTGNEFIYPDKFSESLDTYLAYTGQVDDDGRKFSTNTEQEGRYHSNWLNMMYPRLYLAKNLLRDDGVIFISIDDHEQANLKQLCDYVFGEENFVAQIIWRKRSTPPNDKILGSNHDYIIVFAKDADQVLLNLRPRSDDQIARYRNPDNHPKGPWAPGDLMANVKGGRYVGSLNFPIVNPITLEEHFPGNNGNWRFSSDTIKKLIENNEIFFGEDSKGKPKLKRFLADVKDGVTYPTIWDFVPLNASGSAEMNDIFGEATIFESPKPVGLMQEILRLGSDKNCLCLDFFAGSGSLAHATMAENLADNGKRKFICVQLPEIVSSESEAAKQGLNTIGALTRERIRRAGNKLIAKTAGTLDLAGESKLDIGFKSYKLDRSNFKVWNSDPAAFDDTGKQLELHIDHIAKDASDEDILTELLLKSGYPLDTPITPIKNLGRRIYGVADNALILCLEPEITSAMIDAIADYNPIHVICLDSGFQGNDQLKANAVHSFKVRAQSEETAIVFRTV